MSQHCGIRSGIVALALCLGVLQARVSMAQRPKPGSVAAPITGEPTENTPIPVTDIKTAWANRLADIRKTQPSGIVVLEARWGDSNRPSDVTELVQAMVNGDSLTAAATGEALRGGGGSGQQLRVFYVAGDKAREAVANDGQTLQIGPDVTSFSRVGMGLQNLQKTVEDLRKKYPTGLLVLDARFGERGESDVTGLCQELVDGDSLTVVARNEALRVNGGNWPKLQVTYSDGKEMKTESVGTNFTLQIGPKVTSYVRNGQGIKNLAKSLVAFRKNHASDILVLDATFGKNNGWPDVTDICQTLVSGESLTVPVKEETFKVQGDSQCALNITYYAGDEVKTETVREGATLQVGPDQTAILRAGVGAKNLQKTLTELRKKYPTGIVVLQARWWNYDKTELCQSAVMGDSLTMPLGTEAFNQEGGPFDIDYNDGTETKHAQLTSGTFQVGPEITSFLKPEGGVGLIRDLRAKLGSKLVILTARFGREGKWQDVKDLLQGQVADNRLKAKVGDNWPDVRPGPDLRVEVTYWDGAQIKAISVANKEMIELGMAAPGTAKVETGTAPAQPATRAGTVAAALPGEDTMIATHAHIIAAGMFVLGALIGVMGGRLSKRAAAQK